MTDKTFYRFGEMLIAFLSWGSLLGFLILSFFLPTFIAIFIILYDLYWLFKIIYLSLHLSSSFSILKKNLKINWLDRLKQNPNTSNRWGEIYHLLILPMYNEPYEIVKETFDKLKKARYPLNRFMVVLATEDRAGEKAGEVAKKIQKEYGNLFFKFIITVHPKGIKGELPGKGSNQTYACKKAKAELIDRLKIKYEDVIVSVFDIDTQIYNDYFSILTYKFLTAEKPLRSSYQPVPIFLNNIYKAPSLARLIGFSATFWHLMQQSRPEKLTTFSSHSMPFKALVDIGFWNTNVVSEDSRIFWQCYTHYDGDWRAVPLFYPISMDANFDTSFWKTMVNLYKQQRRWAWGAENIAYILSKFRKNKKIKTSKKIFWCFNLIEGFFSWATSSIIVFSLGWLPVLIGGYVFRSTVLAFNLPQITRYIATIASLGIVLSAILSMMLLPPRPKEFKKTKVVWYLISWLLLPFTLIIFGSIPALDAQMRLALSGKFRLDFWVTPKHR